MTAVNIDIRVEAKRIEHERIEARVNGHFIGTYSDDYVGLGLLGRDLAVEISNRLAGPR